MRQTASIISTYTADVSGVCSALFELGGMTVMHDASGCNSTYNTHDEPRWYDTDSLVFLSGLSELEAVMGDDEKFIGDVAEAARELARTEGNVLLTTGAKELGAFSPIAPERCYPRVLPTQEGIAACEAAGVPHRNIIAMQGPFSRALNEALIQQFEIRWLVTKDGGAAGGFAEKVQAAQSTGAQLVVLRRPPEQGQTAQEILNLCKEKML